MTDINQHENEVTSLEQDLAAMPLGDVVQVDHRAARLRPFITAGTVPRAPASAAGTRR